MLPSGKVSKSYYAKVPQQTSTCTFGRLISGLLHYLRPVYRLHKAYVMKVLHRERGVVCTCRLKST